MKPYRVKLASLIGLIVFAACGPRISDTGYTGTWERRDLDGRTLISIIEQPEGVDYNEYHVSLEEVTRCDTPGVCEVFRGPTKTYEYRFTTASDPATGHLRVTCTGVPFVPGAFPMGYTARLELQPGGREILSYTVESERAERTAGAPPSQLTKLADVPL